MIQSYPHFWRPPFEAPIYWRELEYIGPGFWGLCKGINWRYLLCIGPIFEGYVREYASAMWPPHGTSISLSWDPSATMGTLIESNLGISQMLWIYHILGGISINQLCWGTIGCQAFEPHLLVQSLEGWLRDLQQAQTCSIFQWLVENRTPIRGATESRISKAGPPISQWHRYSTTEAIKSELNFLTSLSAMRFPICHSKYFEPSSHEILVSPWIEHDFTMDFTMDLTKDFTKDFTMDFTMDFGISPPRPLSRQA